MDKLRATLTEILNADPDEQKNRALNELRLDDYKLDYEPAKSFSMKEFVEIYENAARARAMAKIIQHYTLKDMSQTLMEHAYLMARHLHQENFKYRLHVDDIYQTLLTHLNNIRTFALKNGEKEEGVYKKRKIIGTLDWLIQMVSNARKRDSEALEYEGLT